MQKITAKEVRELVHAYQGRQPKIVAALTDIYQAIRREAELGIAEATVNLKDLDDNEIDYLTEVLMLDGFSWECTHVRMNDWTFTITLTKE